MNSLRFKRRFLATRREQIEDYVSAIQDLFWQRQGIFLAVFFLTFFYLDAYIAVFCYLSVVVTELIDLRIVRIVRGWSPEAKPDLRQALRMIVFSTTLSALAISNFVVNFALLQEATGHFPPLFFLFAAALFAAMNNHQVFLTLVIREIIYGVAFVTVALIDVVRFTPSIGDQIWLNFFTVLFVMYFILDVSRVFLGMYRRNLRNLRRIQYENFKTKEAYKIKSRFVSTVSHELRTPLTSIKGSIDLINSGMVGEVPESCANLLRIAGRNSERLEKLINDVLDVQKMETEQAIEKFSPVDADSLLRDSVEANLGYADKHNVTLELVGTLHGVTVMGHHRRLVQVMTNLISNAVKFSHAGGAVEVWAEQAGDKVRFCVCDYGVGIPPDSKDKVFGHFTQIDSSDQRKIGGSGLGMSISKQIVERHGGLLDYVSRFGEGSTFFFELEMCDSTESPRMVSQSKGESGALAAPAE